MSGPDNSVPIGQRAADRANEMADAVTRRAEMLRQPEPDDADHPPKKFFFAESLTIAEPVLRQFRPSLRLPKTRSPKVVMLLPGFGTHPARMRYMAGRLEKAGHTVKHWGMGFNLGPTEAAFEALSRRVEQVHERYGEKMVLVGWSLGGIFAREIAKKYPDLVSKVVTMGSPFSHSPYSNNVWRVYEMITGHPVDSPPIKADIATKPPVETVAFWSARDGIVAARSACGTARERDRARALRCTHMGFSNSPEAIRAVAEELETD